LISRFFIFQTEELTIFTLKQITMASKRNLKKRVRRVVFEVLNECDEIIVNDGKDADKADKLIDEAVDFHDDIIAKIVKAASKKEFNAIIEEFDKGHESIAKKLGGLSK
jgi:hypothetical protein